jgi:NAD(P)-dependent dehydrogenase (short-subunit alcohol dehydrogenase family)
MKNILTDKTCLITGANSGIGKALAGAIAGLGAELVMVCRDRARGESARNEIINKSGNPNIHLFLFDLSSQKSIRNGVREIKMKYRKLDILINNAGVILFKKILTEDGIESMFAVNFLGPFLLTNLLMDLLITGAPARVINVVSEGTSKGTINVESLPVPKKFNPVLAYSQSKQAEILFTHELADRMKGTGVTANCFYPGLVKTNLGKVDKGFRRLTYQILTRLLGSLFCTVEESIKTGIFLAASRNAEKLTGNFITRNKNKLLLKTSYDKETAKLLWKTSEKLTGLHAV